VWFAKADFGGFRFMIIRWSGGRCLRGLNHYFAGSC